MNIHQKFLSTYLLGIVMLLGGISPAIGQVALGKASNFAVLSVAPDNGGAVTCTDSVINGDVGSSGGQASVTKTNCTINGSTTAPVSNQVVSDFYSAYDDYADIACTGTLNTAYTNETVTLSPGVYCNEAAVTFTDSTLILDGHGDANATWLFKIGTLGTGALTGTNFSVITTNREDDPCNVTWWVAQAVTMTTSGFQGTILAGAAITMTGLAGTLTPFNGNALSKSAVTLTNVTVTGCDSTSGNNGNGSSNSQCNQGVGNGPEGCDPGNSNQGNPFRSNDELGGIPGEPGRKGGFR